MNIKKLSEQVETVSKTYAKKFNIHRDEDWYVLKIQEELGELVQSYLMLKDRARAKGKDKKEMKDDFEKEIADVFCHILLLAKFHKIDIEKVIEEKWLKWTKK